MGRALDHAGDLRFAGKVRRYASWLEANGWDQIVYAALVEALGYARNRAPMLALAWRLDVTTLAPLIGAAPPEEAATVAQALILGTAGLLPDPASSPKAALLARHWARHRLKLSRNP